MALLTWLGERWHLAAAGHIEGISFFICLYVLLTCGYSFLYQTRVAQWPVTRGNLLQGQLSQFGGTTRHPSDQEFALTALYSYTVNGKSFQGRRVSPWLMVASTNLRYLLKRQLAQITTTNDGGVEVYYNPAKPQKSFLVRPGLTGRLATLLLATMPLLVYLVHYQGN